MSQLDSDTLSGMIIPRASMMSLEVNEQLYTVDWRQGFRIVAPELGGAVSRFPPPLVYQGPEALLYQAVRIRRDDHEVQDPMRFALKISQNQSTSARLQQEAERQDWLNRFPAGDVVAPVVAMGEHKGRAFFVTHWYELTLARWLSEYQPGLQERIHMLIRVCQAVRRLHGVLDEGGRVVVHGDLKPSNIAIYVHGHRMQPLFIDMGTARATSQGTRGPLERFASPGFAPPNQVIPGAPTLCSDDAFAVAAMLHHALTGHAPRCAALEFRSFTKRDAPWDDPDKTGDLTLFFKLDAFRTLLAGDLEELREQAIDDAAALGAGHVGQEFAEGLVALVRPGLEPDPAKRREDWLSDAEKSLFGLLEVLQRPPPEPIPEPEPEHVVERVIEYVQLPPRPRWPAALMGVGAGLVLGLLVAPGVGPIAGALQGEDAAQAIEPAPRAEQIDPLAAEKMPDEAMLELQPDLAAADEEVAQPEAKVAQPEAKVAQPEVKVTAPDVKPTVPEVKTTVPEIKTSPPAVAKVKALVYPDGEAPLGKLTDPFTGSRTGSYTALPGVADIVFARLSGGEFTMGSPASDKDAQSNEKPQYRARVKGFSIAEVETTQKQWDAVINAAKARPDLPQQIQDELALLEPVKSSDTGPQQPMDSVSWCDALRFADVLSVLVGKQPFFTVPATCESDGKVTRNPGAKGYRLPTEVEWEYAARGGQATRYYNGDDGTKVPGWIGELGGAHDVKGKGANAYGLYDVHGNVWEWTLDAYNNTAYAARGDGVITSATSATYTVIGENLSTTYTYSSGARRVMRGGSWDDSPGRARAAFRGTGSPGSRFSDVGFRLVLPPQ